MDKKEFMRKWGVLIACGALMMGGLVVMSIDGSSHAEALNAQSAKITELENKKDVLESAHKDADDAAIKVAADLDVSRVAKDDLIAKRLIQRVCTWDTKSNYDAMRKGVMDDYGLDPSSAFVKVFMPEVKDVELDGKTINEIDANGLNMEFVKMASNVIDIDGDDYTYMTTVTIQSSNSTGASAEGDAVFVYKTDGDGNLSGLNAYDIGID